MCRPPWESPDDSFYDETALDVNELFLDRALELTFVEPHPELLLSLMKPDDTANVKILPTPVQDLDLAIIDSWTPAKTLGAVGRG